MSLNMRLFPLNIYLALTNTLLQLPHDVIPLVHQGRGHFSFGNKLDGDIIIVVAMVAHIWHLKRVCSCFGVFCLFVCYL